MSRYDWMGKDARRREMTKDGCAFSIITLVILVVIGAVVYFLGLAFTLEILGAIALIALIIWAGYRVSDFFGF